MIDDKDTQTYEENEYDLHRVVISTGYYGSCSVCHSSFSTYNANIQRNPSRLDERTPLLPAYAPARTWRFINIRIFSLGILFIGGVFIGSYLLYKQGREMSIHHVVELISREEWNPQSSPSTTAKRLVSSNVVHILIYQTGNNNCFNMTSCSRMLKQMQSNPSEIDKQPQDIPYNFLISGDGRIYEAKGWSVESDVYSPIQKDKILSIAFIGNFTTQPPPERQLSGALALIEEIEYQRKVAPTYSILGIRCFNRSEHDGAALFAQLANWDRWDQIISIY